MDRISDFMKPILSVLGLPLLLFPWWMKPLGWRENMRDIAFFVRVLYVQRSLLRGPQAPAHHKRKAKKTELRRKLDRVVSWMDEVGVTLLWSLFLVFLLILASVPILCILTQLVILFNHVFATPPPPQSKDTQIIMDEKDPQFGMRKRPLHKADDHPLSEDEQKRYQELAFSPVAQNLRMVAVLPHRMAVAVVERFFDFVHYKLA